MRLKLVHVILTCQIYTVICCKYATFRNVSAQMSYNNNRQQSTVFVIGCIKANTETRGATNITISDGYVPVLLREAVNNLSALKMLTIEKLQVSDIEDGAFVNLPSLAYLSLRNNELTQIKKKAFDDLPLTTLHLEYNRIKHIEDGALEIGTIKFVQLSNNQLTTMVPKWFGISNLSYLYLDSNSISYIEANAFENFKKLLSLNLRNNVIYELSDYAFRGGLKLATINLSNNRLVSLKTETFEPIYNVLRIFYVAGNNLTYLPENLLKNMVKLNTLAIELNPWQCACYHEMRRIIEEQSIYVLPLVDSDGRHPVCLESLDNPKECKESVNAEIIREYSKIV